MKAIWAMFAGFGAGAGLMYLLDPTGGRRRRRRAAEHMTSLAHDAGDAAQGASRDLRNRMRGAAAETRARFRVEDVPDAVLVERVRARMGHLIRHSGSIEVAASDGTVTLRGSVRRGEAEPLVRGISGVRGVRHVENHLTEHEQAGAVPSLQGRARGSAPP